MPSLGAKVKVLGACFRANPILAWFALGSALVLAAAFAHVLFGGQTFFYRDYGIFGYPLAHHVKTSYWAGEWPLWNPYNNCGLPFLAQWNTLALYPLSLIYIIFPLPWSLAFFCLLHLWLSGVTMAFLAERWTGSALAGAVAGAAYAFNGLLLHSLMWPNNIAAFAWLPLTVLMVERAWREGGRWIPAAALVGTLQMLSGAPEIILFTWLILAVLWLVELVAESGQRIRRGLIFPVIALLIAAAAAIQVFPFLDLLQHSQRSPDYANDTWAMPMWGLSNLIVPLFHCSPSVVGVYSQAEQQWTSSYYPGIVTVVFASLAFWQRGRRKVWVLGGILLFSLVMALGSAAYLQPWLKQLFPPLGFIRYPIKFIVLAAFVFPLLAAHGVAAWVESTRLHPQKALAWPLTAAFIAIGLLILIARLDPAPGEDWRITAINGAARALVLGLLFGLSFLLSSSRGKPRQRSGWALLILLLILDGLTHVPTQNPTVCARAYDPDLATIAPRPALGQSRAMISRPMFEFLDRAATSNTFAFYLGHRRALYGNCNLLDRIPKVDGLYSLYLREQAEVHALLYSTIPNPPANLADFAGVSQISAEDPLFTWKPRSTFLPMATVGAQPRVLASPEILRTFAADEFEPRTFFYLSPPGPETAVAAGAKIDAKIVRQEHTAHRIQFEVECAQPGWIVIAQSYHHNWRAFVGGRPVPLQRANHAFQAVPLPAGPSTVLLVYQDRAFLCGGIISFVTCSTLLALLVFPRLGSFLLPVVRLTT